MRRDDVTETPKANAAASRRNMLIGGAGSVAGAAPPLATASHGYRCVAHDRHGHGRSSQPWNGNDMDTYADDLATVVEALDPARAIHVGHSTGGGEVARYIGATARSAWPRPC